MIADDKMDHGDDIAVIGMAGRFPGARSAAEMWRNACAGIESISFFSAEELIQAGVPPELATRSDYVGAKGLCDDIDLFDSTFFEVNSREADFMDPQHRVLLECSWEALEDAGYDPSRFGGEIGIFAGQGQSSYFTSNLLSNQALVESVGMHVALMGNGSDYLTTRVSYKLGLKGPSVNVQTACSTSLVAVHIACQSLLNGECNIALAGGVAIPLPVKSGHLYQPTGIMSPDGHCRAFDAKAEGCVAGSGVGMVVLKPLDKALADGDRIYAVVKGSAINNDGSLKVGYAAPSVEGQAKVIAAALNIGCLDAETITYVETHGTGTGLGDPIEIAALSHAFGSSAKKDHCAITSLKTNIGHLDVAAGIASFMRAALAVKEGLIPPSLYFEQPNPEINFDNSPFYVNTKLTQWQPDGMPRRAGVSSFGIGGTNAHVILEEPPSASESKTSSPGAREWKLLTISARTPAALERATANLAEHLNSNGDFDAADVCYTLQVGRKPLEHRRVVVIRDSQEAVAALSEPGSKCSTSTSKPKDGPVAFMFPGQGAQYVNMGRELYERERVFREQFDLCSKLAKPHLGYDLRERIFTTDQTAAADLDQTEVTQPALFVIEYALAKLWMSWGIRPQAMIGHSIGEYVAACLAGVFSLEDALRLVVLRGKLMQSLPKGSMLAVGLPEQETKALISDGLSLAAVNGPSNCVVSGSPDSIKELKDRLAERRVICKLLKTSHAFHSAMMDPILGQFAEAVGSMKLSAPKLRFISNLTGAAITPEQATDPAYWVRHLRETVRFDDGLRELLKNPDQRLLEIGPGQILTTLARRHPERVATQTVCSSLGREGASEQANLLSAIGELWLAGTEISWPRYYDGETRQRVGLPTYPFERRRHWVEPATSEPTRSAAEPMAAGRKPQVDDWFYVPLWAQTPPLPQVRAESLTERHGWLFLADRQGIAESLSAVLRDLKQETVMVKAGARFERINDHEFTIAPNNSNDYVELIAALAAEGRAPSRVVHCWTLDDESADKQIELGFYSLIWLAQALAPQSDSRPINIAVLSSEMQKVAGETSLCPEKATLLGPCKVLPQEYPNIACRSIDLIVHGPGATPRARLIERLQAELCGKATDPLVAYRGDARWVQTIQPSRLSQSPLPPSLLRERGAYLITGGVGGIGLEVARYLAQAAKARLVLTSRSEFPERSDWDRWLATHPPFDQTSQRINKLRVIEALGGELMICPADVTDITQMSNVLSAARERYGELNGVIHAAGLAGGGVIQLMSGEEAAQTLAPKLQGARVLDTLLEGSGLDFFVLFSSVTAITGGFGQSAYCAANAFLDAFAAAKSEKTDTVTVSIAWDAWREVGMAARLANPELELGPLVAMGKTDHPLLHHYAVEATERETYVTEFSPEHHWVLDEHRIAGNPVIPGAAYLEMARAAFERRNGGNRPVEIRDVFFITPLRVPDGKTTEVYTVLEKQGSGFRFEMKSRDGAYGWQQHAMGSIGYAPADDARQLPINEIIERCRGRELAPEGGRLAEDDGPRWQSLKHIYVGGDEMIAAIELKQEFATDFEFMKLHPSLLDVATSSPKQFVVAQGGSYLPLSYKRLVMKGSLQPHMYSYGKRIANTGTDDETLTFDIIITDQSGRELAEVQSFVSKRVNDAALRLQAWDESSLEEMLSPATDPLRDAMRTDEAVDAFARILSQPLASRIIVATRDINEVIEEVNNFSSSGMLKRPGAAASHPRPELGNAYVAPRNDVETKIANVWQELFGIAPVGVDDNFFELGGDSILAIQIITRCAQAGIQIPPQELFQHPTVAELARIAGSNGDGGSDIGAGVFSLAPAQVALIEGNTALARGAWAVLIRLSGEPNVAALQDAIQRMTAQHQVFRLRFEETDMGWQQRVAESSEPLQVNLIDLSAQPYLERESAIRRIALEMSREIDPANSPLARATIAQVGPGKSVMLFVMHRLISDEASLPIMLDGLGTAYEQIVARGDSQLRPEAVPFTRWLERLHEPAPRGLNGSDAKGAKVEPTNGSVSAPSAPARSQDANEFLLAGAYSVRLTAEETRLLSDEVASAYRARTEEILLTALVRSFATLAARHALTVEVDFDDRREESDLDLSRTLGPISIPYTISFNAGVAGDAGRAVRMIKEQLRASRSEGRDDVPPHSSNNGAGAARRRERSLPGSGFSLTDWAAADRFRQLPVVSGVEIISISPGPHRLDVRARMIEGMLEVEFAFDESEYELAEIEKLGGVFEYELRMLIEQHVSAGASGHAPSDFPLANLNDRNLSNLALLLDKADET
jgi:phthiocerol/phenolphthiocerol synthesis type-I polyketide synthase E